VSDVETERAKAVSHIRRNRQINLNNIRQYSNGLDREQLLQRFVETGDRGALEMYRMHFIAETLAAVADAIEDGTHDFEGWDDDTD
jgi:hypothetical protein